MKKREMKDDQYIEEYQPKKIIIPYLMNDINAIMATQSSLNSRSKSRSRSLV